MTNKEGSFLFQKGNPLLPGAVRMPGGYNFCASFPEPENAVLLLTDPESGIKQQIPMKEGTVAGAGAAVFVACPENTVLQYTYSINGQYIPDLYTRNVRNGINTTVPDGIHAVYTGGSGMTVPVTENTLDDGRPVKILPEDMILYKLHVRGFTKNDPSVPKEERGTFAGLIRKIPYIKGLGFNTVELMPIYSFDPVLPNGRKNYWGFAENNQYFAPNAAYCAGDDPVKEACELISELHKAGIACILEFYIPESTSVRILTDALRYWSMVMGADGFHLSGKYTAVEEALQDPYIADRILLLDLTEQAVSQRQLFRSFDHVYAMQQDFRREARKFLNGHGEDTGSFTELFRCCPAQYHVVNYIADHNGFTLQDFVSYNEKRNEVNGEGNRDGIWENDSWNCGEEGPTKKRKVNALRRRQIKNALLLVFLSQGIPMLFAGDEFGNSQNGNNNAYCLDNEDGWLDWENASENKERIRFLKEVIRFRKKHRILHTGSMMWGSDFGNTGMPDISFHGKERFTLEAEIPALAVMFNGYYAKPEESSLFLAMNAWENEYGFALPMLPEGYVWKEVLTSAPGGKRRKKASDGMAEKAGISAAVIPPHTFTVFEGVRECLL